MEIGQFDEISFSQPIVSSGTKTPVEIMVNLEGIYADCRLIIDSPSIQDWNNTVIAKFEHESKIDNFEFQIGKNKIIDNEEINCFYENTKIINNMKKGSYYFKNYETFGDDNTFNLISFKNANFDFYGTDDIEYITYQQYFITRAGSKILFKHFFNANDNSMPPIYLRSNTGEILLSNCQHLHTSSSLNLEMGFCEINQEELDFIEKNNPALYYKYMCTYYAYSSIHLYKLNLKYNPAFEIIKFYKPSNTKSITSETDLLITAKVLGNVEGYENNGKFHSFIEIEHEKKNISAFVFCSAIVEPNKAESNFTCNLEFFDGYTLNFENLYLLPYTLLGKATTAFEVYINDTIKANFSQALKYSVFLFLTLLLL